MLKTCQVVPLQYIYDVYYIYVIRYIIKLHSAFQDVICLWIPLKKVDERDVIQSSISVSRDIRVRVTHAGVRNTSSEPSELTQVRFTRNPGALHNTRPYERERLFRIP